MGFKRRGAVIQIQLYGWQGPPYHITVGLWALQGGAVSHHGGADLLLRRFTAAWGKSRATQHHDHLQYQNYHHWVCVRSTGFISGSFTHSRDWDGWTITTGINSGITLVTGGHLLGGEQLNFTFEEVNSLWTPSGDSRPMLVVARSAGDRTATIKQDPRTVKVGDVPAVARIGSAAV